MYGILNLLKVQQVKGGEILKERFETFTVLINRISRSIRKIENKEMAEYNLRSVHVSCLFHLYQEKNLTATELCDKCEEDKATISRAITYLEKHGFLACESKTAKRYKTPLNLTDKGIEAGKKIFEKINHVLNEVNCDLDEKEIIEFYRCLTLISERLEKISNTSIDLLRSNNL